jgi:hypothetical protein
MPNHPLVSDRQGRWIFVGLREMVGETCIGEYVTARTHRPSGDGADEQAA